MVYLLKLVVVPLLFLALVAWVLYCTAQVFLDDLGGPGDGPGYT